MLRFKRLFECAFSLFVFSVASIGYRTHEKKKSHKYDSKSNRLRKKPREKDGVSRRTKPTNQRPSRSHSDDEEDEGVPASYHTVSLQVSQDVSTAALSLLPVCHHACRQAFRIARFGMRVSFCFSFSISFLTEVRVFFLLYKSNYFGDTSFDFRLW